MLPHGFQTVERPLEAERSYAPVHGLQHPRNRPRPRCLPPPFRRRRDRPPRVRSLRPRLRRRAGRPRPPAPAGAEIGAFAPHMPREHGGAGFSLLELAFLGEVLGRSPLGHYVCNCQAPDSGNMELLLQYGSAEQKERWLGPLVRGEIRSCFGMTEPGFAGSNPVWLGTTARRDGDDYVIDGRKWFTSSAEGSAFCVVMAMTEPQAVPHQRASQILVPLDTPGFSIVRNLSV